MTTASNSVETTVKSFNEFAVEVRALVESELDRILPAATTPPVSVHSAMRWSVFAGGKRFRPLLLIATGKTFGAEVEKLITAACAFELIHTYSLIHDDLPSMDDDDLRRGQPTCHVKFGDATAILAGDALQTLAFQIVSEASDLFFETRVQLISELARAAGTPSGMVAGQAHDLEGETRDVSSDELEQIHRLKTAALIIAAARCGALIGNVSAQDLNSITHYASQLGLLFQITDDLLDITSTAETLGKTPGKDARSQKATYPSVFGVDSARDRAVRVHADACVSLSRIARPTNHLREIADFILNRTA